MWTLKQLCDKDIPMICINDKWVPARPINWKYRSIFEKLKEAWAVWTGKADAFAWPEEQ